jgi:hypothetical protein
MKFGVKLLCWLRTRFRRKAPSLKFHTKEEALEFIQRAYRESGGPNEKLRNMWRRYEEARKHKR